MGVFTAQSIASIQRNAARVTTAQLCASHEEFRARLTHLVHAIEGTTLDVSGLLRDALADAYDIGLASPDEDCRCPACATMRAAIAEDAP